MSSENSSLYERLALSRNKDEVMRLAQEGAEIEKPADIVKQPTVIELLGLEEQAKYSETELEDDFADYKNCASTSATPVQEKPLLSC